jgi:hypothetical protein
MAGIIVEQQWDGRLSEQIIAKRWGKFNGLKILLRNNDITFVKD